MGWKFRSKRSIKILPGVRLNFGKKGVSSVSIGSRGKALGATTNINFKTGKTKQTYSIRGVGSIESTSDKTTHRTHTKKGTNTRNPQSKYQSVNNRSELQNILGSKKNAASIFAILLGYLGVHKFILGYRSEGLVMLFATLLTGGLASPIIWLVAVIEGIIYLSKSDEEFSNTYLKNKKSWF
ncbi:DUF4236 domain-containing protein [Spirulina sp. CCNP1310]|uniref:DUF4236 domain-containing protein n=1 Tax=Spirulina sp. CCNP1310 TaxID=3110249 RepID=UPI002B20925E|nr:DUF4236 domain-containing protein [Spirulina sp. CCNP1310]MEA5419122.1 DUF4236 domain-containing protein [Spirulina sp. CCNP1310]